MGRIEYVKVPRYFCANCNEELDYPTLTIQYDEQTKEISDETYPYEGKKYNCEKCNHTKFNKE